MPANVNGVEAVNPASGSAAQIPRAIAIASAPLRRTIIRAAVPTALLIAAMVWFDLNRQSQIGNRK
jgi:hypothetical protein